MVTMTSNRTSGFTRSENCKKKDTISNGQNMKTHLNIDKESLVTIE